jgi:uncharacterized repeat protein (TIGR01451 family)
MQGRRLLLVLASGLGLALGLLCLLDGSPVPVSAGPGDVLTVCKGGSCDYDTVQAAVDAATGGEIIKVAAGTYDDIHVRGGITQVVYVSATVTIQGGYTTTDWGTSFPVTQPTVLDAGRQGRVISVIGAGGAVTVESVILTGGDAAGLGGGPSWASDVGGGIYAASDDLVLVNSAIYSNSAQAGGGVYLYLSDRSRVAANVVYDNGATWGAGLYVYGGEHNAVADNHVYSNTAGHSGGGLYLHQTGHPQLSGNTVCSNTAQMGDGSGAYLGSVHGGATISGNTFCHNTIESLGRGGGLYAMGSLVLTLEDNDIYGNEVPSQGGGLYLSDCRDSVLRDNSIYENVAGTNGGGLYLAGGSVYNNVLLESNEVYSNTGGMGGGIYVYRSKMSTIRGNTVYSNAGTSSVGGGISVASSDGIVLGDNLVYGNSGPNGGGIYLSSSNDAVVGGNQVYSNTGGLGSGLYVYGGSNVALVNNVIADNPPAGSGYGLLIQSGDVHLLHTTLARNGGPSGYGVLVQSGATAQMTNTVLTGHAIGIWVRENSTTTMEATLWGSGASANGTDWQIDGTLVTGTLNLRADPGFVDADRQDYHLADGSPAIDSGVSSGVGVDIDGYPRPLYWGYDLGADEWSPLVPIKAAYPTVVDRGDWITYTMSLINTTDANMAVQVTDTLHAWVDWVGPVTYSDGDGGYASGIVTWTGTVYTATPSLITWTVQVKFDTPYSTTIPNAATVRAPFDTVSSTWATVLVPPVRVYLPVVLRQYP